MDQITTNRKHAALLRDEESTDTAWFFGAAFVVAICFGALLVWQRSHFKENLKAIREREAEQTRQAMIEEAKVAAFRAGEQACTSGVAITRAPESNQAEWKAGWHEAARTIAFRTGERAYARGIALAKAPGVNQDDWKAGWHQGEEKHKSLLLRQAEARRLRQEEAEREAGFEAANHYHNAGRSRESQNYTYFPPRVQQGFESLRQSYQENGVHRSDRDTYIDALEIDHISQELSKGVDPFASPNPYSSLRKRSGTSQ